MAGDLRRGSLAYYDYYEGKSEGAAGVTGGGGVKLSLLELHLRAL